MPVPNGLLLLCSPLPQLHSQLGRLVAAAARHVSQTLYVQMEPQLLSNSWRPPETARADPDPDYVQRCNRFIARFYAGCHGRELDVRFCVSSLKRPAVPCPIARRTPFDVVITDVPQTHLHLDTVQDYLAWRFVQHSPAPAFVSIPEDDGSPIANGSAPVRSSGDPCADDSSVQERSDWKFHDRVVLGGTFDRLHGGHKILLSESVLRCTERLTIGICVGPMIAHKKLWELIEPIDVRRADLHDFLTDIDGSLEYELVPITDPFGPAIEDPTLQGIVVSRETVAGGKKVNEKRIARGMNALDIHVIDLLPDPTHGPLEEDKISSSSLRMRVLGQRQEKCPQCRTNLPPRPYIIGLTGGIASGKSSIARRLRGLGASIVDCDRLGHASYLAGSPAYRQIVQHFGQDVIATDGSINRKVLGPKVFENKVELDVLNGIVWPEIRRMADEQIRRAVQEDGARVVVLDAAVLLEAGWEQDTHEVWVCFIPEDEAVRRIGERDGLDEAQARQRLGRQMSNVDRIAAANVVFCTLWEPEYTQSQVQRAWSQLQEYLNLIDQNSKM